MQLMVWSIGFELGLVSNTVSITHQLGNWCKLLYLSEPQFFHLSNGGVKWEIIYVKCLAWCRHILCIHQMLITMHVMQIN